MIRRIPLVCRGPLSQNGYGWVTVGVTVRGNLLRRRAHSLNYLWGRAHVHSAINYLWPEALLMTIRLNVSSTPSSSYKDFDIFWAQPPKFLFHLLAVSHKRLSWELPGLSWDVPGLSWELPGLSWELLGFSDPIPR